MKDTIDFLDRIEGHGYGGMASYEIARTTAREGAAEIDRLTAGHEDYVVRANANVCELLGEIERLRAALTEIAAIEDKMYGPDWEEIEEARKIARAALCAERDLTKMEAGK